MAAVDAPGPLAESVQRGIAASTKYLAGNFLRDKDYSIISRALAAKHDKFQSMTAAMKLMEQHGVHIDESEQERLSSLSETQMIEQLVSKMPQQSKEQFQHFFLQLQLIVSTATRVRQALEQGREDLVEQAMSDADSTGVSQYILKMAIVQAGAEVTNLSAQHSAFVKDAEAKMSRLVKGAEDAVIAKGRLAKAQGDLAAFQTSQNEHIKKVLMTFAGGSQTALQHGVLNSWHTLVRQMKIENAIYEEYREEIEMAEQRLIDAKADQLKSVKGMIEKKHQGFLGSLTGEVFKVWQEVLEEKKADLASAEQVRELEEKLRLCQSHQAESAKKVMARCGAASGVGLRDMCFHEWLTYHKAYLKDKEFEDKVKEEEARIAQFMKGKSDEAKGLLNRMSSGSDSCLLQMVVKGWYEAYMEEKRVNEFALQMAGAEGRMGGFGARNKASAKNACERAHEHNMTMLYLKVWGAWRIDTMMEKMLKHHQGRIDGKRSQLLGVQQMFRNFAQQLESNIQAGQDSNRDLSGGVPPGYKKQYVRGVTRSEQAMSLPDIHAKPSHNPSR